MRWNLKMIWLASETLFIADQIFIFILTAAANLMDPFWRSVIKSLCQSFFHLLHKPRTYFHFAWQMVRLVSFPTSHAATRNWTHISLAASLLRDLNPGRFTDWADVAAAGAKVALTWSAFFKWLRFEIRILPMPGFKPWHGRMEREMLTLDPHCYPTDHLIDFVPCSSLCC